MTEPTTAYRRIARNRLYARILLAGFFILLLPVFLFLSTYLGFWLALYLVPAGGDWPTIAALDIGAALLLVATTTGRVIYVTRFLPTIVGAVPLAEGQAGVIRRRLEDLCLAAGLPVPRLYVLPGRERNAFATGSGPERASIVLTEGLLDALSRRELDGVIAHELAHIRNHDIRLNSLVAAIVRTVRLPAPIYWLLLLTVASMGLFLFGVVAEQWGMIIEAARDLDAAEIGVPRWLLIALWGTFLLGQALILVWPGAARLIQSRICRRREYLADAEAVTITRDPIGLSRALMKVAQPSDGEVVNPPVGIEHLCIASWGGGMLALLFPTHPPTENRIAVLERMGVPEPMFRVEPPDPEIREAAARAVAWVRPHVTAPSSVAEAAAWGLFIGIAAQVLLFGLRLYQARADPSLWQDARALSMTSPFGLTGVAAALVAMRLRRRFFWWPLVLMFVFGGFIPFTAMVTLLPEAVPLSAGSVLLVGLIGTTEPAAGALLGAFASKSILELLRDGLAATGR